MSARAIPAHLEGEVIARHLQGHSLRAISAWLQESQRITASREAVSGLLHRNGVDPEELSLAEVTRQLSERTDDLTTQLFECLNHYRQLVAEALKPEPAKHVRTALQAAKSWAQLLMWSLRAAGAQIPVKPRTIAERNSMVRAVMKGYAANHPEKAEAVKPIIQTPTPVSTAPTSTPPRNQPCTCGSGQKWKKCCGSPVKATTSPGRTPDSLAALSG